MLYAIYTGPSKIPLGGEGPGFRDSNEIVEIVGMSKLFEPTEINGMVLSNRFVRSATYEGMATEKGAVTPKLTDLLVRLANGGLGLIITGHAYVQGEGQAGPWQLGEINTSPFPINPTSKQKIQKGGELSSCI
jgi:2,4-dienoyl-CoA reductase-like NADH-dependent reductase (Old Yellow Enzyme family)